MGTLTPLEWNTITWSDRTRLMSLFYRGCLSFEFRNHCRLAKIWIRITERGHFLGEVQLAKVHTTDLRESVFGIERNTFEFCGSIML